MSDIDTKVKRSQSRKRNFIAKSIKDYGEHKGAFSLRVLPAKKQEYKRLKSNNKLKRTYDVEYDEEEG